MSSPDKQPHATPAKVVSNLKMRGMSIENWKYAEGKIDVMGYARLRMYESKFCNSADGKFNEGTTFDNLLNMHKCDEEIRMKCFSATSHFEILFRNCISEALSENYGAYPYKKSEIFESKEKWFSLKRKLIQNYSSSRRNDNVLINDEYEDDYNLALPAIWHLKEILNFSLVIDLYRILNPDILTPISGKKIAIEKAFGMTSKEGFIEWIESFRVLRNLCAHHGRVFDHKFNREMARQQVRGEQCIPEKGVFANSLAALLQCLDYVAESRGSPVNVEIGVKKIVDKYEEINNFDIGYNAEHEIDYKFGFESDIK